MLCGMSALWDDGNYMSPLWQTVNYMSAKNQTISAIFQPIKLTSIFFLFLFMNFRLGHCTIIAETAAAIYRMFKFKFYFSSEWVTSGVVNIWVHKRT